MCMAAELARPGFIRYLQPSPPLGAEAAITAQVQGPDGTIAGARLSELHCLVSSTANKLCGLRQVTVPLRALVFSPAKWELRTLTSPNC